MGRKTREIGLKVIRAPAGDLRSPVRARAIWPTSGRGARHAGCSLRTALPGAGRDKKETGKLELPGRRPGRPAAGGNLETLPKCIVLSVTLTLALVGFLVTNTQAIMKNNNSNIGERKLQDLGIDLSTFIPTRIENSFDNWLADSKPAWKQIRFDRQTRGQIKKQRLAGKM